MKTEETTTTPLLVFGDTDAEVCADGFCAVPPAKTGPEMSTAQTGTGE
jgi:hypothetical protein